MFKTLLPDHQTINMVNSVLYAVACTVACTLFC